MVCMLDDVGPGSTEDESVGGGGGGSGRREVPYDRCECREA